MKVLLHNALDLSITSVFWANNSLNFSSRLSRSSCYGALIFLICNSAIVKGNNRAWTAQWDAFSLFNMLTLCANKVVFFYNHMYGVRVHLQQLESLRGLIVSFKARYSLNSISCAWQPHEMSLIDAENLTPANFAFFCMRTPDYFLYDCQDYCDIYPWF